MRKITIEIEIQEAEDISHGLSDLLCWVRGYLAGKGDDDHNCPIGQDEARRINAMIKTALNEAKKS